MNEGKGNEQKEAPMVDCKRYTWNLGTLEHWEKKRPWVKLTETGNCHS